MRNFNKEILDAEAGVSVQNATGSQMNSLYRRLRGVIGFPMPDSNEEMRVYVDGIRAAFATWRMRELLAAATLSTAGHLAPINCYGSPLTANHMRDTMSDYAKRKAEIITKFRRVQDQEPPLTEMEKQGIMAEAINDKFKRYLEARDSLLDENYVWHHLVDWCRERGLFYVTEAEFQEYLTSATTLAEDAAVNPKKAFLLAADRRMDLKDQKEMLKERFAWYLILLDYFDLCKEKGQTNLII